jgi:hypothetical protein
MGFKIIDGNPSGPDAPSSVATAGDVNGDGRPDLLFGAAALNAAYYIDGAQLPTIDAADGTQDELINLDSAVGIDRVYKFTGTQAGEVVHSAGDVDLDGRDEILISAREANAYDPNALVFYLINKGDFAAADAADGSADGQIDLAHVTAQPNSYKFVATPETGGFGFSLQPFVTSGNLDGDTRSDLLFGAGFNNRFDAGKGFLSISGSDIVGLDSADGTVDGLIDVTNVPVLPKSYFVRGDAVSGDAPNADLATVQSAGTGEVEILTVGEGTRDTDAAVFLTDPDAYAIVDVTDQTSVSSDGSGDGIIRVGRLYETTNGSYKLNIFDNATGEGFPTVSVASAGNTNSDGFDELLIGVSAFDEGGLDQGAVYLVDPRDLAGIDAADGTNGIIDVGNIATAPNSYKIIATEGARVRLGTSVTGVGDIDGDGFSDFLLGAPGDDSGGTNAGASYLVSSAGLAAADAADGARDGVVDIANVLSQPGSFKFIGEQLTHQSGSTVRSAGDLDGDGKADLLIVSPTSSTLPRIDPAAYVLFANELSQLDQIDGVQDSVITLSNAFGSHAPFNLTLSVASVRENTPVGTVLGRASAQTTASSNAATFSLVDTAGGLFSLDGANLVVNGPLDHEARDSHAITLRASNGAGHVDQVFSIRVSDVNEPISGITLSMSEIDENAAIGTLIGRVTIEDPDDGAVHFLEFLNSAGGLFTLGGADGRDLLLNGPLDFETAASHTITLTASDRDILISDRFDQSFTVNVRNVAEPGETRTPDAGSPGIAPAAPTAGDGPILTGAGGNNIALGDGSNTVQGLLQDFFGDQIAGFGTDDALIFQGSEVKRDQITVTQGSAIIAVDQNRDGIAEGAFTLAGDFTNGDFMAVTRGGNTSVTFETFLPTLTEGAQIDARLINGINNQAFLTGDGTTGFRVTLDAAKMGAAFSNTLGVYEVDASGNIVDARILADNVKTSLGSHIDITGIEAGHQLGFFIIQNGAAPASNWSETDSFVFTDGIGGAPATIASGPDTRLSVNGVDTGLQVFHSYNAQLNPDSAAHALSGVDLGGQSITIGFEDLIGGDNDFQDVVFSVSTFEI